MNNPISPEQALEIFHEAGIIGDPALYYDPEMQEKYAAVLNLAITKYFGEPELYMAKNLHSNSYATHPNKAECELYLMQSGLKNDGAEAAVLPLYARKE